MVSAIGRCQINDYQIHAKLEYYSVKNIDAPSTPGFQSCLKDLDEDIFGR